MIYLKAFESILPPKVKNHLDIGTGEKFRFNAIISAEHSLYNNIDPTLKMILMKYLLESIG